MIRPQCGTRNGYQIHGKNGEEACPPCKLAQSAYAANYWRAGPGHDIGPNRREPCVPGEWVHEALCAQADPEEWFPDLGESTQAAKAICRRCPVRDECLDYALRHPTAAVFGVWGGMSPQERKQLRKRAAA